MQVSLLKLNISLYPHLSQTQYRMCDINDRRLSNIFLHPCRQEDKKEQIRQKRKAHNIRARIWYRMEEEELLNDESLKDYPFIISRKEEKRRGNFVANKVVKGGVCIGKGCLIEYLIS